MKRAAKPLLATALATLLASGFAACGGGSNGDSSTAARGGEAAATTTTEDSGSSSREASASGEASASFRTPGGDNSIQNFGKEADAAEVEAAAMALTDYMQAQAEEDWAGECTYLAAAAIAPLEQLASRSPKLEGKGCPEILATLSAAAPSSIAATAPSDGIASLRVEGDRGFALYHGARGVDYFIPMARESGEWKVGALAPTEFP